MAEPIVAGLAETIRALRAELREAMCAGAGESLRFGLGPVQLDLTLAITKELSGDGGVRFGVVSFGARGGLTDATTHHLSLSLQPVVADAHGRLTPANIFSPSPDEPL